MLKLTPKPIVLQQLKATFPKGVSAQRQLAKYVATLERMINRALFKGDYQLAMKWFSVPTSALTHDGGRIGNPPIRLHKWLETNGLSLITMLFPGNKNSKDYSKVKLSKFVDVDVVVADLLNDTNEQLNLVHKFLLMSKKDFLATYMPILNEDINKGVNLNDSCDFFPVDSDSLAHYIDWLIFRSTEYEPKDKYQILTQALIVLKCATYYNGFYPQKRKISDFGRTYYRGVNIQNVNKTLRRAALGDCWQYDANAAVFAYKLSMAKGCHDELKSNGGLSLEEKFKCTISLVKDKKYVREMIRKEVFGDDFPLSGDEQIKLVKQAITAIGFGAQLRVKGWMIDEKKKQSTALNKILKNIECRQRFVDSYFIKSLMVEQKILNDYIYKETLILNPHLLTQKKFLNKKNKPIKNKVLSFAYQTGETTVMNEFRSIAAKEGYVPIANVHDAVIFKKKLLPEKFNYVRETIQYTFGEYWTFEDEELEGFTLDRAEKAKIEQDEIDYWKEQDERILAQRRSGTLPTLFGEQMEVLEDVVIPPESHPSQSYRLETYVQNASATPYTHPVLIP
jgi:hypothetical protein